MICQSGRGSPAGAFARCQLKFILPCSERHSPDFIFARASKPPFASYRYTSPFGCSPLDDINLGVLERRDGVQQRPPQVNLRHFFGWPLTPATTVNSAVAPALVGVAPRSGPTSDTLTEGANTASAARPGQTQVGRPLRKRAHLPA